MRPCGGAAHVRFGVSNRVRYIIFTRRVDGVKVGHTCSLRSPGARAKRPSARVASLLVERAPERYVLRTGLAFPSVRRLVASLGDDSIVDLLTAVTPIRARTTTLWHDNSSSEPHRSRATQAIRRRSANSSAQQRPPQQPNVATTALPLLRTTVAPAR